MDILDGLQLDCDQDQVINTLIKTFQPHELPIPIDCFHNRQFEVEIWKNDRNSKKSFPLKIWVQRQKVVDAQCWNGPLIGDREIKEYHMGLVGVWSVGLDDYHAMYVTKCKKDAKGEKGKGFNFAHNNLFSCEVVMDMFLNFSTAGAQMMQTQQKFYKCSTLKCLTLD